MRLFAVSDLHIDGPEDPLFLALLQLIRQAQNSQDRIVLAGDIFDLYISDKQIFRDRYRDFFTAIREASTRGVEIHYIEGNHDFHIRGAFRGIAGFHVHSSEVSFRFGGKNFYFAHGDLVDPRDFGYRALRMVFRSPVVKAAAMMLPDRVVDGIGRRTSQYSRMQNPILPGEQDLGERERIRCVYRNFAAQKVSAGFDFIVMGHCHDLDEMAFKVGSHTGHYMNVGFPRKHGSCVFWQFGEEKLQRVPFSI